MELSFLSGYFVPICSCALIAVAVIVGGCPKTPSDQQAGKAPPVRAGNWGTAEQQSQGKQTETAPAAMETQEPGQSDLAVREDAQTTTNPVHSKEVATVSLLQEQAVKYVAPLADEILSRLRSGDTESFDWSGRSICLFIDDSPDIVLEIGGLSGESGADELRRAVALLERLSIDALAYSRSANGIVYAWDAPNVSFLYLNCYLDRSTWKSQDWKSLADSSDGRSQYPKLYKDWHVDSSVYSVWTELTTSSIGSITLDDDPWTVVLDTTDGKLVYSAMSEAIFDELAKTFGREDYAGLGKLILSKQVLEIPSGTKAYLIDGILGGKHVRVEEGEFAGCEVWTFDEWVQQR